MKRIIIFTIVSISLFACRPQKRSEEIISFQTNASGKGQAIELEMKKGKNYSHPLLAIWVENEKGEYIQTLYVSQSIAKGMYGFGDKSSGQWKPGPVRRPAALPYWAKKRNVMESDGLFIPTVNTPMADAYTGPTPQKSFRLFSKFDEAIHQPFRILFEINQAFDFNPFWTNNLYPQDDNYKTSGQPALVFCSDLIDPTQINDSYTFTLLGHSDPKGNSSQLNTDVSTITSALNIVHKIELKIKPQ